MIHLFGLVKTVGITNNSLSLLWWMTPPALMLVFPTRRQLCVVSMLWLWLPIQRRGNGASKQHVFLYVPVPVPRQWPPTYQFLFVNLMTDNTSLVWRGFSLLWYFFQHEQDPGFLLLPSYSITYTSPEIYLRLRRKLFDFWYMRGSLYLPRQLNNIDLGFNCGQQYPVIFFLYILQYFCL